MTTTVERNSPLKSEHNPYPRHVLQRERPWQRHDSCPPLVHLVIVRAVSGLLHPTPYQSPYRSVLCHVGVPEHVDIDADVGVDVGVEMEKDWLL